jgi:hypothetical protein
LPDGFKVAILERQVAFGDRVRGELMQPRGAAEAMQLDLGDVFDDAGGIRDGRCRTTSFALRPPPRLQSAT